MPRRYITGLGFGTVTITTTAANSNAKKVSAWQTFGPCRANQITFGVTVTAASTKATTQLEGLLTTSATGHVFTIASRTYSQRASLIQSTVNATVCAVRLRTSGTTGASGTALIGWWAASP